MKIERLHLINFRGITDCVLELPDTQTIVLVGVNGAGKSSILDCTAILLSKLLGRIRSASGGGRSFSVDDIRNGESSVHGEISLSWREKSHAWTVTKVRPGRTPASGLSITSSRNQERTLLATSVQEELTANERANVPLAVYYSVNRAVLDIPLRIRKRHTFDQLAAYDGALGGSPNSFRIFFEWFRTREDYENEMWRDQAGFQDVQLNTVRRAIEALMPGYTRLRVRRNPLRMVVEKEGEELNVSQLSDGEKCLLALAGDLARRLALANPGLKDPSQGEAIVLIDEIELHLHPTWQRNAVPCLEQTFPNCQFIISTHSAPVLGHVKPEGVLLLTGRGELMDVRRITTYGQDTNRILEEVFGATARPVQFEEALNKLFREIDGGALGAARTRLHKLEKELGDDEPELARARVLMHRKELIGK